MAVVQGMCRTPVVCLLLAIFVGAPGARAGESAGMITIETQSIGAGLGFSWGYGRLNVNGAEYRFSVDGVTLFDVGVSKATAVGAVYNLVDLADFEGHYVAAEASLALGGGFGGVILRNPNGVVMRLSSVAQGARLHLGSSGVNVKFW